MPAGEHDEPRQAGSRLIKMNDDVYENAEAVQRVYENVDEPSAPPPRPPRRSPAVSDPRSTVTRVADSGADPSSVSRKPQKPAKPTSAKPASGAKPASTEVSSSGHVPSPSPSPSPSPRGRSPVPCTAPNLVQRRDGLSANSAGIDASASGAARARSTSPSPRQPSPHARPRRAPRPSYTLAVNPPALQPQPTAPPTVTPSDGGPPQWSHSRAGDAAGWSPSEPPPVRADGHDDGTAVLSVVSESSHQMMAQPRHAIDPTMGPLPTWRQPELEGERSQWPAVPRSFDPNAGDAAAAASRSVSTGHGHAMAVIPARRGSIQEDRLRSPATYAIPPFVLQKNEEVIDVIRFQTTEATKWVENLPCCGWLCAPFCKRRPVFKNICLTNRRMISWYVGRKGKVWAITSFRINDLAYVQHETAVVPMLLGCFFKRTFTTVRFYFAGFPSAPPPSLLSEPATYPSVRVSKDDARALFDMAQQVATGDWLMLAWNVFTRLIAWIWASLMTIMARVGLYPDSAEVLTLETKSADEDQIKDFERFTANVTARMRVRDTFHAVGGGVAANYCLEGDDRFTQLTADPSGVWSLPSRFVRLQTSESILSVVGAKFYPFLSDYLLNVVTLGLHFSRRRALRGATVVTDRRVIVLTQRLAVGCSRTCGVKVESYYVHDVSGGMTESTRVWRGVLACCDRVDRRQVSLTTSHFGTVTLSPDCFQNDGARIDEFLGVFGTCDIAAVFEVAGAKQQALQELYNAPLAYFKGEADFACAKRKFNGGIPKPCFVFLRALSCGFWPVRKSTQLVVTNKRVVLSTNFKNSHFTNNTVSMWKSLAHLRAVQVLERHFPCLPGCYRCCPRMLTTFSLDFHRTAASSSRRAGDGDGTFDFHLAFFGKSKTAQNEQMELMARALNDVQCYMEESDVRPPTLDDWTAAKRRLCTLENLAESTQAKSLPALSSVVDMPAPSGP